MIDVKLLLARILTRLIPTNAFVVESHRLYEASARVEIAAYSQIEETTKRVYKEGYSPIAIAGWNSNGNYYTRCFFYTLYLTNRMPGAVDIIYGIRNSSSELATLYPDVYILWAKEKIS